jgi:proline iminopeptidase
MIEAPRLLYPPLNPYQIGYLDVGDGHELYWETCGNPDGVPVVFLHGGPGGGCSPDHRRLFNPDHYRIILFDQRGAGRSRPLSSLTANTTQHLIGDMERVRQCLGVERWLVLGGSWGAMLGLLYAQSYPQHTLGLILRGVFTGRAREIKWLYQEGAHAIFPREWEKFCAPIPAHRRHDMVSAYYELLTSGDADVEMTAAQAWCTWEAEVMTLLPRRGAHVGASAHTRALAQIEAHYFAHHCFIDEGHILSHADQLSAINGTIVQGRYDIVTPVTTAYELHKAWPRSKLVIVPDAGHATGEAGITDGLINATDMFALTLVPSGV